MYAEETTATYDEAGNLSQFVKKDNSIMSNVLDLMSNSTLSLNRILMNDVRKRMGDLRASEGTHGVQVLGFEQLRKRFLDRSDRCRYGRVPGRYAPRRCVLLHDV